MQTVVASWVRKLVNRNFRFRIMFLILSTVNLWFGENLFQGFLTLINIVPIDAIFSIIDYVLSYLLSFVCTMTNKKSPSKSFSDEDYFLGYVAVLMKSQCCS